MREKMWPNLRHHSSICQDTLKKLREFLDRIVVCKTRFEPWTYRISRDVTYSTATLIPNDVYHGAEYRDYSLLVYDIV
jgi:hypothetical protein